MPLKTPRIVLSKETRELVSEHLTYYADPENNAPQVKDVLVDADGEWFINYLEAAFVTRDDDGYALAYDVMIKHKHSVEYKINEYCSEHGILAKYLWVAQYHNYFCNFYFPRNNELLVGYSIGNGTFSIIS